VIEDLLKQIHDLLMAHGDDEWARTFHRFLSDYESKDKDLVKGEIRSVYGGMCSFNDVILYGPNYVPLRAENDELDRLRSRLFAACQPR
jgi:hypothetical protein